MTDLLEILTVSSHARATYANRGRPHRHSTEREMLGYHKFLLNHKREDGGYHRHRSPAITDGNRGRCLPLAARVTPNRRMQRTCRRQGRRSACGTTD